MLKLFEDFNGKKFATVMTQVQTILACEYTLANQILWAFNLSLLGVQHIIDAIYPMLSNQQ